MSRVKQAMILGTICAAIVGIGLDAIFRATLEDLDAMMIAKLGSRRATRALQGSGEVRDFHRSIADGKPALGQEYNLLQRFVASRMLRGRGRPYGGEAGHPMFYAGVPETRSVAIQAIILAGITGAIIAAIGEVNIVAAGLAILGVVILDSSSGGGTLSFLGNLESSVAWTGGAIGGVIALLLLHWGRIRDSFRYS